MADSDDEEPIVDENKIPSAISSKLKIPHAPPAPGLVPAPLQAKSSPSKFPFSSPTTGSNKQQSSSVLSPILPPSQQTFVINDSHGNFMNLTGDQLHGND